ncbi:putative signal transducing protein [Natranaerovirga pectinivora]|uniref:Putative signal transducing protein n=1 Tax=Natranaerovirga pectinivora TaxID=682400 RepID=A0A4R3MS07_9FIRM|nr:DUF2007 domain-containing protein [Natranaerovirga pectinivora]TCT16998.1 putative signal transducing protein [Natranaerovirga pectinivora]
MPWCLKCKSEYEEGVEKCVDCMTMLSEDLVENNEETLNLQSITNKKLLITVGDISEAHIIASLLSTYGIKTIYKHNGSGEYLQIAFAKTIYGIQIFVDELDYKEALEIINNNELEELMESDIADIEALEIAIMKKRIARKRSAMKYILIFAAIIYFIIIATAFIR